MTQIINGREIAAWIKFEVAEEVSKLRATIGRPPKLVVIQVGDNPASSTYVRNKKKACEECGIECEDIHLPKEISQFELSAEIDKIKKALESKRNTSDLITCDDLESGENEKKIQMKILHYFCSSASNSVNNIISDLNEFLTINMHQIVHYSVKWSYSTYTTSLLVA